MSCRDPPFLLSCQSIDCLGWVGRKRLGFCSGIVVSNAMPAGIRSASPDAVNDVPVGGADCIGGLACGRRSSFSYRRLPEPCLRLTVRKLDASCFDVQIVRSAAVWELKAAIEDVFFAIYDDPERAITWQHVWSHFCLCFKDEKLTDDRATLRPFAIRDGDEFVSTGVAKYHTDSCNEPASNAIPRGAADTALL